MMINFYKEPSEKRKKKIIYYTILRYNNNNNNNNNVLDNFNTYYFIVYNIINIFIYFMKYIF